MTYGYVQTKYAKGMFLLWCSMWGHYVCSGHWNNYFLQLGR
jgi:hypothetical protein